MKNENIEDIFSRGVSSFIDPGGVFKDKLIKKTRGDYDKKIIVKFGVDPTRPDIHLGHAVILRKLRALQECGCTVVFVVGDFTARIGDPTGKSVVRPEIEQKEIEENMKTFVEQVGKIVKVDYDRSGHIKDSANFSWIRNSDWFYSISDMTPAKSVDISIGKGLHPQKVSLSPDSLLAKASIYEATRMQKKNNVEGRIIEITMRGFLWTLKHITHARLSERDMFKERIHSGQPLFMHEMLYPVLQGIDSYALSEIYGSCDLEIGGSDQTFNMLIGRDVMEMNNQEPQSVMSLQILEGTDGVHKMSKSLDNYISIVDTPDDMFGKVMSIPDSALSHYFELCTYDVLSYKKKNIKGESLKREKISLAHQIVAIYHGEKFAEKAEKNFEEIFSLKKFSDTADEFLVKKGTYLLDFLFQKGIISSRSEVRRLMRQGGIHFGDSGKKIEDEKTILEKDVKIKVGKKIFLKIKVER